jgi:hypothetical protein
VIREAQLVKGVLRPLKAEARSVWISKPKRGNMSVPAICRPQPGGAQGWQPPHGFSDGRCINSFRTPAFARHN